MSQSLDSLHGSFAEKRDQGDVEGALAGFGNIAREIRSGVFRNPDDFYKTLELALDYEFPIAEVGVDRAVDVALGPEGSEYRGELVDLMLGKLEQLCTEPGLSPSVLYDRVTLNTWGKRTFSMRQSNTESSTFGHLESYRPDNDVAIAHRLVLGLARIVGGKDQPYDLEAVRDQMEKLIQTGSERYPKAAEMLGRIMDPNLTQSLRFTELARVRTKHPELDNVLFDMHRFLKYLPGYEAMYNLIQHPTTELTVEEQAHLAKKELINLGMDYQKVREN